MKQDIHIVKVIWMAWLTTEDGGAVNAQYVYRLSMPHNRLTAHIGTQSYIIKRFDNVMECTKAMNTIIMKLNMEHV